MPRRGVSADYGLSNSFGATASHGPFNRLGATASHGPLNRLGAMGGSHYYLGHFGRHGHYYLELFGNPRCVSAKIPEIGVAALEGLAQSQNPEL